MDHFKRKYKAFKKIIIQFMVLSLGNRIIGLVLGFIVLLTVLMGVAAILYYFNEDSLTPIERAKVILSRGPLIDGT